MSDEFPLNRKLPRAILILGIWILIGIFFSGQGILTNILGDHQIDWQITVFNEMLYWLIWAALTPGIFWFARRFPVSRNNLAGAMLAHFLFAVILSSFQAAVSLGLPILASNFLTHTQLSRLPQIAGRSPMTVLRNRSIFLATANFYKYWLVIGAFYAFDYYRRFREQKLQSVRLEAKASDLKARLARAELDALKMQLHPHFLFNTLNAISMLMNEDLEKANLMLLRLSELLRVTLDNAGKQEITFRQELACLNSYLEIEQIRFEGRLNVSIQVDPLALDAHVPNLLLQPLVENAVRHGVSKRATASEISIRANRNNGQLLLEIYDDGPGFGSGISDSHRQGIGLSNTRARLNQLYGDNHSFALRNRAVGGAEVLVAIPFSLVVRDLHE